MEFACLNNDGDVIAESMIDREDAKDLGNDGQ